jgi:hypothetical protein
MLNSSAESGPKIRVAIAKQMKTTPPRMVTARTLIFLAIKAPARTANLKIKENLSMTSHKFTLWKFLPLAELLLTYN